MSSGQVTKKNPTGSGKELQVKKTDKGSGQGGADATIASNDDICVFCKEPVLDTHKGLECEICERWYHIGCQGVTPESYVAIGQAKLHWYCSLCDKKVSKLVKSVAKLEARQDKFDAALISTNDKVIEISKELKQCEGKVDNNAGQIVELKHEVSEVNKLVNEVKDQVKGFQAGASSQDLSPDTRAISRNDILEELEIDRRKMNLVIMGLPESDTDVDKVKEVLNKLVGERSSDSVAEMERIGKPRQDGEPRPLRLKLSNQVTRRDVLKEAPKLKDDANYKEVFVTPDLTRKQQKNDKDLRDKLKKFRKDGEENVRIRKGKIVKLMGNEEVVLFPPPRN